jgi:O-antigen biosynthesis protein
MTPLEARRQAEVTVAIATRDRPDMLDRCLQCLLSESLWPREIVVADQSRDERTAQVVQKYRVGTVELVYLHQAGQGLGTAQNLAMRRARCEVVAVTDDDCVPAASWLSTVEAAFAGLDSVDVLTGPVLPYGPDRPDLLPVATRTSTTRIEFGGRAMPWEIGSGNNFAVKRAWLEQIGGNDERLGPGSPGRGGVDMDLFYRLARAGARIRYEPEAVVYHERADQGSRLARRGPYGYGMGACCSLWLRQGDANALRVLARWGLMRTGRLAAGLVHGNRLRVREEILVLAGTLGGLLYGWRASRRASSQWAESGQAQHPITR